MNSFYRYLRPVRFNEKRLEFVTLASGGVCLRFDENPEAGLTFSFARCLPDDNFNKVVARRIADERMRVLKEREELWQLASVPYSENTEQLVESVIKVCRDWKPDARTEHLLIVRYLTVEWLGLADQLERLMVANGQEKEKARHYLTAAHALELAAAYEEKARAA